MNFLQNGDNKQALYPFLKEVDPQNRLFVSKEDGAITNVDACSHLTMNLSCNHEEADTRLFVHVHHAIKHSAIKTVAVLSNDVDIVVIAVRVRPKLGFGYDFGAETAKFLGFGLVSVTA